MNKHGRMSEDETQAEADELYRRDMVIKSAVKHEGEDKDDAELTELDN